MKTLTKILIKEKTRTTLVLNSVSETEVSGPRTVTVTQSGVECVQSRTGDYSRPVGRSGATRSPTSSVPLT